MGGRKGGSSTSTSSSGWGMMGIGEKNGVGRGRSMGMRFL